MSIVTLLSGGLDSCLMSLLTQEIGRKQLPLFIDYGQLSAKKEYEAALSHCNTFNLPELTKIDISGYGSVITSGLTNHKKDVVTDAFLPGRNMVFLLLGSSFAYQNSCTAVSIGLLREDASIFSDQTSDFLHSAEYAISKALGHKIEITAPLREYGKKDVIEIAETKMLTNYYSCHLGGENPCGKCISCMEFEN